MESIFKLGIVLSVLDRVTDPSSRIGRSLKGLRGEASSLGPVFKKFKTYGLQIATFGAIMLNVLNGVAMATVPSQMALGELASVGVRDLAAVAEAGRKFANQWAGTDQAQFITAAYDIKSGISSLSDTGVAEFTRLAALTGKATKSTTEEMTSLFATGYGIYKNMYANLSDMQFGQMFSAGLAGSVQAFKTTGSGMAGAISNLGATATTSNVPLQEQLAILGMLQATMSGNEAGTKYRAMLQAAGAAGQKLGLQFMDANHQLLSMPQILTALRAKYGETLDAIEKEDIKKAFGSDEAVAVIDLLYGSIGKLEQSIGSLSISMGRGTDYTREMALTMNADLGSVISILGQRFRNLTIIIGNQLSPVLIPLFNSIGSLIVRLQEFATRHEKLTRVFVISLAVIASVAFVLGTLAAALGAVGLIAPNISAGWSALAGAAGVLKSGILTVVPAVWSFTAALLANPITWVVIGVVALVAGLVWLYKRFQAVRNVMDPCLFVLGVLVGSVARLAKALLGLLSLPMRLAIEGFVFLYRHMDDVLNLFKPVLTHIKAQAAAFGQLAMVVLRFVSLPLRLVIKGFVYLYQHVDGVRALLGPVLALLGGLADKVMASFSGLVNRLSEINLFDSGVALIKTMVSGIESIIDMPEQLIRKGLAKVRNLLPFSDAKEGPLSDLTLSGTRLMQTLGAGVQAGASDFHRQVAAAVGGAVLATSVAVSPVAAGDGVAIRRTEVAAPKTQAAGDKTLSIRIDRLELPGVSDGRSFIRDLERLVEGYDG